MEGFENYQAYTEDIAWDSMKLAAKWLLELLLNPKIFFPLLAIILLGIGYRILMRKLDRKRAHRYYSSIHYDDILHDRYDEGYQDGYEDGKNDRY